MADMLAVETEELVLRTASGTYRIRRIPWWRNKDRRYWRVERADEHGHWWPVHPADYTEETGLYRWPDPQQRVVR